tara:strand:+ start:208 stop:591 length:384 start_codon:yes stop_codon:yes gene_type:complete
VEKNNMAFKLKNEQLKQIVKQLKKASNSHAAQAKKIDSMLKDSPLDKRMGKFQESDAPDAKGKFRDLAAPALASWMIKSRKGNLSKIISSLNQQVVFRRNKDPKYAAKMKRTMDIVRKRLGKDEKNK